MSPAPLANNLRRLRDALGLSQAQVAERAGISRVAYRSIETGAAQPRFGTLSSLANALSVKIPDLMVEVRALQAVRFREKGMTSREQLLVRVAKWLEAYGELEDLLGDREPFGFRRVPGRQPHKSGIDGAIIAAASARRAVGLKAKDLIRDICGLLEENGVKVYPVSLASEGFFGLSVAAPDGGPAVVVNIWDRISVERWIFTAAHELGHLLLHLNAYDSVQRDPVVSEEKEADVFAAHFLMPPEVFAEEWELARGLSLTDRVLKLKRMFHVSYRTVLHRLQDTTPLGKSVWGRFQVAYRDRCGRTLAITEEPDGLTAVSFNPAMVEAHSAHEPDRMSPTEFCGDRLIRLVRAAVEKHLITLGRAAEILGLDLVEMRQLAASWVT